MKIRNLRKSYQVSGRRLPVLTGLNLELEDQGITVVLGRSGCGKTTLLRLIAGLEEADSGEICLGNGKSGDRSAKQGSPDNRRMGVVFQEPRLMPWLTVEKNILFGVRDMAAGQEKLASLLELTGLAGFGKARPGQLSGGMQQRVALARALVLEPGVLLFDEPLSNLDAKLRVSMRTEIRKIQQKVGITAIYVTHDQSEAMSISDKIIIMSRGKVEQIGTPQEIYYHPTSRFVADFIGEANFLEAGVLSADGEKARIQVAGKELLVNNYCGAGAGDEAALVIRPEAAVLAEEGYLEATVTLSTFMGSYQYYQVMVGDMEIQITDYNPVNRRIYQVGEKAFLDFDARGVYIL